MTGQQDSFAPEKGVAPANAEGKKFNWTAADEALQQALLAKNAAQGISVRKSSARIFRKLDYPISFTAFYERFRRFLKGEQLPEPKLLAALHAYTKRHDLTSARRVRLVEHASSYARFVCGQDGYAASKYAGNFTCNHPQFGQHDITIECLLNGGVLSTEFAHRNGVIITTYGFGAVAPREGRLVLTMGEPGANTYNYFQVGDASEHWGGQTGVTTLELLRVGFPAEVTGEGDQKDQEIAEDMERNRFTFIRVDS